jgi:hypothetical protein
VYGVRNPLGAEAVMRPGTSGPGFISPSLVRPG